MLINNVIRYVADQDRSIDFWTGPMGFDLRRDAEMSPGSRWVEVCPPGHETGIALLRAADFEAEPHGGEAPFTFVTDDIRELHARMTALGVTVSEPTEESYGTYLTLTCPDGYEHVVSQLAPPDADPDAAGRSPGR